MDQALLDKINAQIAEYDQAAQEAQAESDQAAMRQFLNQGAAAGLRKLLETLKADDTATFLTT